MIVIVDVNEHMNQEGVTYVQNVDTAIEKLFHSDIEGIVLTESVCESEKARLKAIVNTIDNDIVVVQKTTSIEDGIKEIEEKLRFQRLSQVTFSDTMAS
ncbi:MAG: hypothetical protein DI598_09345 [Pseudopedobacter saltans]|uniref:Uncharacterized protein n=1 Tax=Pseudopedobacter saltans TaxID=151895 RepID=A0A2W5H4K1_9SPHI|nr:MAG: hypothetical protein DI598_09345 [Pseudopedobacter saltans]